MDADGLPIVGPGIDLTKASFLLAVRQGDSHSVIESVTDSSRVSLSFNQSTELMTLTVSLIVTEWTTAVSLSVAVSHTTQCQGSVSVTVVLLGAIHHDSMDRAGIALRNHCIDGSILLRAGIHHWNHGSRRNLLIELYDPWILRITPYGTIYSWRRHYYMDWLVIFTS